MRLLTVPVFAAVLVMAGCGSGGPVTPLQSFNVIKQAVERRDVEAISVNLTDSSIKKIEKLQSLIRAMDSRQRALLSVRYGLAEERLLSLKATDAVGLYFFSDKTGINLGRYFNENVLSVDIHGSEAIVKTGSGIELDFKREGPYWKFDISEL